MMGPPQEAQAAMFYEFLLEDHVPHDLLQRSIDRFVDLNGIRAYLSDFYSHMVRRSGVADLDASLGLESAARHDHRSACRCALRRGSQEIRHLTPT